MDQSTTIPGYSTSSLISSIGINVHTDYWDTGYGLPSMNGADIPKIEKALNYLGVNSIRSGILYDYTAPPVRQLAADGYKLDLVYFAGPNGLALQQQVNIWASLASSLNSVEGPNEPDNFGFSYDGKTGLDAARAVQTDLYSFVRSNSALDGIPVIEASLGNSNSYSSLANLGNADYGNTHSYFFDFSKPIFQQIPARIAEEGTVAPGLPTIATEAGYESSPQSTDWFNVDQVTQAKLTLDLVLDQFKAGVPHTYLYELLDVSKVNDYFGVFDDDGNPKLAATALHNMTTILHDDGTGTSKGSDLSYSLSTQPDTMQSMLLYKSNGMSDIALWNEAPVWYTENYTPGHTVTVSPFSETVKFDGIRSTVQLFDPLVGTDAVKTWVGVDSVTLDVPDHPVFIEVGPALITVPVVPTTPVIPVIPTTPVVPTVPVVVVPTTPSLPTVPDVPKTPTAPVAGTGDNTGNQPSSSPQGSSLASTLYRFFDKATGTHFLTSDANEASGLQTVGSATYRADLVLEQNSFGAISASAAASDPKAMAIERLFDTVTGTHFFTSSHSEVVGLTTVGSSTYRPDLVLESGSNFYGHQEAQAGDVAVYRFFDTTNGTHFFTGSSQEAQALMNTGTGGFRGDMVSEGIAFWAPAAK